MRINWARLVCAASLNVLGNKITWENMSLFRLSFNNDVYFNFDMGTMEKSESPSCIVINYEIILHKVLPMNNLNEASLHTFLLYWFIE